MPCFRSWCRIGKPESRMLNHFDEGMLCLKMFDENPMSENKFHINLKAAFYIRTHTYIYKAYMHAWTIYSE
jgi:hypothetical protein